LKSVVVADVVADVVAVVVVMTYFNNQIHLRVEVIRHLKKNGFIVNLFGDDLLTFISTFVLGFVYIDPKPH